MQDYFKEFFEKQGRKYIKEIVAQKRNHVVFDFDELMNWDSTVTNILIESPERGAFEEFRQAMIDAIAIESSNQIDGNDIEIGFIDNKSVPLVKLHNIGAKHVGKIIKVRGLVNRLSFVRPMYLNVVFKCRECGKTTSPILQESPLALTLPSKGCCSKNKLFDPVESLSSAIDSQEFALQELHEDVTSRVPQRTRMFIKLQYLINRVNCGDEVEVIGLVKLTSMYKQHVKSRFNEIYLEVLGIDKKSKDPETLEITPEEELEIQELANKPNIYQILIDNVAPSIFGHRDLKEACLLSLFGGVDRQREINIRGNIHVLFVGDPSTSKSQLLRATAELSPRGMYSCYDDQTEILTENGWKYFKDLEKGEKVATLEGNNLLYVVPSSYMEYDYNGIMFHQRNRFIDLLVTPNHNLWIKTEFGKPEFKFISAEKSPRHVIYKKGGVNWNGTDIEWFNLPSIENKRWNGRCYYREIVPIKSILMDDWLAFFGIWLAEGCVIKNGYRVVITQKKKENLSIIKSWIEKCGFHTWYRNSRYSFEIKNKQLWSYLKQFGKAGDKFIPKEIKQLNSRQLKILFDSMMLGDGCYGESGSSYSSKSKRLIGDVQELLLKVGLSGQIWGGRERNTYGLAISKKSEIEVNSYRDDRSYVNYSGKVYCVTVPNHLLYVRRNGKPIWCGNSGQGVTAAGLTAAMNKDDSGEWMIEAGVLVLSDNGVACIDEIDKMRKEDRVNIHEAMEQQIVSINKAGIHATLKARTSVIAAANPLSGKYDPSKTVVENLSSFPPTLFSRFDLIFIVIDKPNEDLDTKVIEHIWGDGEEKEKVKLDRELFKKYIAYAKRIKPEVSPEARKILNNYFLSIRKHMQNNGESDTIPIYFRQFEALRRVCEAHARILLKPIADESDAEATKKIFNSFLESVRFDMEVIETGKSPKDAELQILEIIREHQGSDHTIGVTHAELLEIVRSRGLTEKSFNKALSELLNTGKIHSPSVNCYRTVGLA